MKIIAEKLLGIILRRGAVYDYAVIPGGGEDFVFLKRSSASPFFYVNLSLESVRHARLGRGSPH